MQAIPAPAAAMSSLSPLALQARWASRSVVGRPAEQAAVRQELAAAKEGRLAALTFEGEPGIGKSRLLVAAAQTAEAEGFAVIAVTADEELRGPFLVARSLLASREAHEAADDAARAALAQALDGISGRDAPEMNGLSPDQKLLRAFDLGAVAVRALAAHVPVALLIDDLQWADEDSVRMLRYIVRAAADMPLLLILAVRPEEMARAAEVGALLADMQRMGMVRRLQLSRLTQTESAELLKLVLGDTVEPTTAATMHAQAEGVPFILEELAHSFRDSGLVQQIDGVWRLGKKADRLVPSTVRTLIQRRAGHLPSEVQAVLAEAAIIGRAFSLQDLQAVKQQLGEDGRSDTTALAEALAPAVATGLLTELPESAPADYRFTHEHVRDFAADSLTVARRRAIHAAIVDMLTADAEPTPESLPLLAQHALAAGDAERAARFSCEAAQAALDARAPEEVLRIVELALPALSKAQDRVALLTARDDALDMLRQPMERLEGLAELGALAEALDDRHLVLDVMLRRAAALRLLEDEDVAAQLAGDIRRQAGEAGDRRAELAACLEQGQALLRRPIGESFVPPGAESDLDGAAEAYERAAQLASELGDLPRLAAANRELGVIELGHLREAFVEIEVQGQHLPILERVAAGESAMAVLAETPLAPMLERAQARFDQAVELFDQIGDRRGLMSSIIAMAYAPMAVDIHMHGSATRIEEIRRLATQLASLARESDRDRADAQMLYGVHVFARAKGVADLALTRGKDAYDKGRVLGDQLLEFAAAGGVALAYLDLGELEPAAEWLNRAAATAAASPTPFRTRQLELWRGMYSAASGDVAGMRQHLERAVQLATDHGRPAARCEALARLALEAARLGAKLADAALLDLADDAAGQAAETAAVLPGLPLWAAQAAAARACVALARGEPDRAAEAGGTAMEIRMATMTEDLDLDMLIPAARAIMAGGTADGQAMVGMYLRLMLAFVAQRILDEDVRVRWFRGPLGRELVELAGPLETSPLPDGNGSGTPAPELGEDEMRLLGMLVEGRTNREIGEELGVDEQTVAGQLTRFYAKIGTSSRAEATAFAFRERVM